MKSSMFLPHTPKSLLIGNGINRYNSREINSSWEEILVALWEKETKESGMQVPQGISLTEFYDALEIRSNNRSHQSEFCSYLSRWLPSTQHRRIIDWARSRNVPILTTNFDYNLSKSASLEKKHIDTKHFTDFYPWKTYFSDHDINNPEEEFGIWHVNGMIEYPRSIRLGLSHYMGSVERARKLIHKGNEARLFSGKNQKEWQGKDTWLHIFFNTEIYIIGLSLEENEVFIRWLLIERAKYFRRFPDRYHNCYYLYSGDQLHPGHQFFLENVNVDVVHYDSYDDIYETLWV